MGKTVVVLTVSYVTLTLFKNPCSSISLPNDWFKIFNDVDYQIFYTLVEAIVETAQVNSSIWT